jgi:PleD family two-component response regulator
MTENSPLVLIVEDSPTQALKVATTLIAYGARIRIASDGLEGLRSVHELKPDLVVLDIYLPKMDGYQVCSRLKRNEETAHIPVVMLTAWDLAEAVDKSKTVGANDYVLKDEFASDKLIAILHRYIKLK